MYYAGPAPGLVHWGVCGAVNGIIEFAMLTRVFIDNFRSFQNFEYFPQQRQLLLGANGTGKTSLLEALRRLKSFVKDGINPFTRSTRTRWTESSMQVFEIGATLRGKNFEYRLELDYAESTGEQVVALERLTVSGRTVFELAGGQIRFYPSAGESVAVALRTNRSSLPLSVLSNDDVRHFVGWLSDHVHCFDVDPYPGQMDEVADREEREPDYELNKLAGWYRSLVTTYPDQNIRYLETLRRCMDGFLTLKFSSQEDGVQKLRAEFVAPTKKRVSYSISELSEGQRCLISLYMILHFPLERGDTVFIDEPDNFVALREIQPWLLSAEEVVEESQGQLILISHHPETLNHWARLYGLRFFREQNGQVRVTQFAPAEQNLPPSEVIARGWE